jgi:hypothetical protein
MRVNLVRGIVFLAVLGALTARDAHHVPSALVLEGQLERPWSGTLRWDSGGGFNDFELKPVSFPDSTPLPLAPHRLQIVRDGTKHDASGGAEVWVRGIELDDGQARRALEVAALSTTGATVNSGGRICLTSDEATLRVDDTFSAATIQFDTHPYSGRARVLLDGQLYAVIDLYAPAEKASFTSVRFAQQFIPGPFAARIALPQAPLRGLRLDGVEALPLTSARVVSANADVSLPTPGPVFTGFDAKTRTFHPGLLTMHVLLAMLLAWLAGLVAGVGDWRSVFVDDRRWVFWSMFATSTVVFSTWLLAWWPGMLTLDSLDSWLQVKRLEFTNWNPFVYTLYVLALTRLWDSPAVIVLVQVVATAALGASVFFFLHRQGLRFRWVAPFFAVFTLSLPVGVYNLMVWRDVPFCLLTVFWACLLFGLAVRRARGRTFEPSWRVTLLLAGVLVFSSTVRHNGLVSLFAVPLLLAGGRLVGVARAARLFGVSAALYVALVWGVGTVIGAHRNTDYRLVSLSLQLNSWAALLEPRNAVGGVSNDAFSDDPEADRRVLEKFITREELERAYNPLTVTTLVYTSDNRLATLTQADADAIRRLYVRRMLENFHIFLAERTYLFFATLGFRNWGYANNLPQRVFPKDGESLYYLHDAPKVRWLRERQEALLEKTWRYEGLFKGAFLSWNAFVPLLVIVALFLLYKWLPMTALSCAFILTHALALFFTVISNDFRYVYFLQLFAYFVVPMAMLELTLRRQAQVKTSPAPSSPQPS